jgi:predicted metal-dependent hydrolase
MNYTLIRTRRKTIALIVQRDGSLVVRAPLRASQAQVDRLVTDNDAWIRARQAQVKAAYPPQPPHKFLPGESFWYLGKQYGLEITAAQAAPPLTLADSFQLSQQAQPRAAQVFEGWYRQQAARVLAERVEFYAKRHAFSYQRLRISAARSRWGSCSAHGVLSFAWRLVMAPEPVIDYVVIHELAHLRVRNHSKTFWAQVAQIMPDYKQKVAWLKANGSKLTLD